MTRLTTVAAAVALPAVVYAGLRPVGPLPPLGGLLDPARGAWAAARPAPRSAEAGVPGLGAPVEVRFDRRGVPHVFARTVPDAYRALGYVVARDRLFQLDVQTRAASGRLTELVGERALPLDQDARALGLPRAAERKLAALPGDSPSREAAAAYADGVNAYVDRLRPGDLPLEYRLLGRRPERWQAVNTMHLLMRMGYTLSYNETELARLRAAALVGRAAAAALVSPRSAVQEPIQPNGAGAARVDAVRLPPPGAPDSAAARLVAALGPAPALDESGADRRLASNNWAVAPSRTAGGHALLAGDPHLGLTLPSIWYEAHLVVPGELDSYGVTLPGAPGVVIGFNRDVAWTFTNTSADVLDLYAETVDDQATPTRYRLDGAWRPLERRVERYLAPDGRVLRTDTVRFTHRGPLRQAGDRWLSMRWTVLEPSDELRAFAAGARARTAAAFQESMARWFWAPAQNMLAADRGGAISIRSTGRFPLRPGDGSGLEIRDGSTSASDWRGYRPVDRYPQAANPAQGFLASANQQPVDPRADSSYLGADTDFDPWRAARINQLLRGDSLVTADAMRRYQTDPGSARADLFAPALVRAAAAVRRRGGASPALDSAATLLAGWDRRYTRDNTGAVLFEAAMDALRPLLWDELVPPGGDRLVAAPTTALVAGLLLDSASTWWDDRATPAREDRDALLAAALAAGFTRTVQAHGPAAGPGWRWERVRHANVHHLLRLPALSALDIPVQGGPATLSPSSGPGTHGASWRMVVELGDSVRAWGTYPGGQSGNPASPEYTSRLPAWTAGRLDPLLVPRTPADLAPADAGGSLTLRPPR